MNKTILYVLLAILLISGGIFATTLSVTSKQGEYISVPEYGFFACEEQDTIRTFPSTGWNTFSTLRFNCDQMNSGLSEECDVVLKMPDGDTSGKYEGLQYKICTEGQICTNYFPSENIHYVEYLGVQVKSELSQEYTVHLSKNQYIFAEYTRTNLLGSIDTIPNGRWKVNYKPFYVRMYDSRSQYTGSYFGSEGCIFSSIPSGYEIVTDVSGGGDLEDNIRTVTVTDLEQLRNKDSSLPYITAISPISMIGYEFFDAGNKYCRDYKVYQVERLDTTNGWYRVVNRGTNRELYSVECCNVADAVRKFGSGYTCNEDFEVVKVEDAECGNGVMCPIVGKQPTAGSQVLFQECINNKCVTKFEGVPCAFDDDCDDGKYCEFDELNPQNSKCVSYIPSNFCGNAVCDESRGETYNTCPSDCEAPSPPLNIGRLLAVVGISLLLTIILSVLIAGKMKKAVSNKAWRITLITMIAVLTFILAFLVVGFIVNLLFAIWALVTGVFG